MQTPAKPMDAISPGALSIMMRPSHRPAPVVERVVRGGKVTMYPSPEGMVRIVGISDRGKWLAEFACLEEDYNENMMLRMARHVMKKARKLAIVS